MSTCTQLRLQSLRICIALLATWALVVVPVVHASQAAQLETLIGIVGKDFVLLAADSSIREGLAVTASNIDKIVPLSEPIQYPTPESDIHKSAGVSTSHNKQQQCILAAAAGDAALSERLLGRLQSVAAIQEYQVGVGRDVSFFDAQGNPIDSPVEPGTTVDAMAHYARSILSANRPNIPVCLLLAGMKASDPNKDSPPTAFLYQQLQQQVRQAYQHNMESTISPSSSDTASISAASATHADDTNESSLQPALYWLDELGSFQRIPYGVHGLGSNFCLSILDQGYRPDMTLDEATALLQDCFQQLRTRFLVNSPQPPCIKCVDAFGVRILLQEQ